MPALHPDLRFSTLVVLLSALWPVPVRAQQAFDLRTFVPPPGRAAAITIAEPELPEHGTLLAGATLGYARGLLERQVDCSGQGTEVDSSCVRGDRDGRTPVLSDLADLELSAALALYEALQLGVTVPFAYVRIADDLAQPTRLRDELAPGDVRLAIDLPILRGDSALGLGLVATVPSGDERTLVGARGWSTTPGLVLRQRLGTGARVALRAGYRMREHVELLALEQDDELDSALGLAVVLASHWEAQAELRARVGLGGRTQRENESPVELGGAIAWHDAGTSILAGAGAGIWPGFRGYGAPDLRLFLGLRQALELGCGRFCRVASSQGQDPDADRVLGGSDQCPHDPEDRDGFADGDGCPDHDDDADGLADTADPCPRKSEDRDGRDDDDGCPE